MIEADEIEAETDSAEEPEAQQSEEGKPSKKKAKAQKGDASAALYAAITALGLAVGTSFKKLLTGPKKLGRTIVGFFGYIFRFLWLGFKKFVYIISHTFVDQVKTSDAMCAPPCTISSAAGITRKLCFRFSGTM